jgi:uncharacterized phage protein gp47/JayE
VSADPFHLGTTYTERDYFGIREDLRARLTRLVPDWTNFDQGLESVLVDMVAQVSDGLHFYADRLTHEQFIQTALRRSSVYRIAELFGYVTQGQTSAEVTVKFTKDDDFLTETILVPAGTALYAQEVAGQPILFETVEDLEIPTGDAEGEVLAREGTTVSDVLGQSDGVADQRFSLFHLNYISGSARVWTLDGPGGAPVEWSYVDHLVQANSDSRVFTTRLREEGNTVVVFGDGVSGRIPSHGIQITVQYRHGLGAAGNVGAGAVKGFAVSSPLATKFSSVTNEVAAAGGGDVESLDSLRNAVPRSLRAVTRAVTLEDFEAYALRTPGVAKASAVSTFGTSVSLYIAPVGGGEPSLDLLSRVSNDINSGRVAPAGSTVTVSGPSFQEVLVEATVVVDDSARASTVLAAATEALANFFSFDRQGFGVRVARSDIFSVLASTPGVKYVDITTLSDSGSGVVDVQMPGDTIATLDPLSVITTEGGL